MVAVKDICWLAGLLEGEGSFYTYTKKQLKNPTTYPELSVQSNDEDVILRASLLIGSRVSDVVPYNYSKLKSYKVRACSTKAIQWMMTIYPLMGIRRKAKIKEVITAWKTSTDGRKKK